MLLLFDLFEHPGLDECTPGNHHSGHPWSQLPVSVVVLKVDNVPIAIDRHVSANQIQYSTE